MVHGAAIVAVPDEAAFCRAGSYRPTVTIPNAEMTSESQRPVGTGPTRKPCGGKSTVPCSPRSKRGRAWRGCIL